MQFLVLHSSWHAILFQNSSCPSGKRSFSVEYEGIVSFLHGYCLVVYVINKSLENLVSIKTWETNEIDANIKSSLTYKTATITTWTFVSTKHVQCFDIFRPTPYFIDLYLIMYSDNNVHIFITSLIFICNLVIVCYLNRKVGWLLDLLLRYLALCDWYRLNFISIRINMKYSFKYENMFLELFS